MFNPVQINLDLTKRESKWIQVCPHCQNERIITYSQAFNIIKNKCNKECKPCALEIGLYSINKTGLIFGRKFNGGTTGRKFKNKGTKYLHLFNSPSKNIKTRERFRKAKLGLRNENTNNWQGGKTKIGSALRCSLEYNELRLFVLKRDNYTCQICNKRGGNLEMDHIKEWCNYPELRLDSNNCRTLCNNCHKKTDNYGTKAIKNKRIKYEFCI